MTRLSASTSSSFNAQLFPAAHLIDGDMATLIATESTTANWAQIAIPASTPVSYVAIYNRNDESQYMAWLGSFDVYVGTAASPYATKCGSVADYSEAGPRIVQCPTAPVGDVVRIEQTGAARYLTIAELFACSPSPPYPPALPPSPFPPALPPPSPSNPPPSPVTPPPPLPPWAPPPPAPAPPIESLTKVTITGAQQSSVFSPSLYPVSAIYDGDVNTLIATNQEIGPTVSVQLAGGAGNTNVCYVRVFNRGDNAEYAGWLSPFEIYVGSSYGDVSANACNGPAPFAMSVPPTLGPFMVNCHGHPGSYVTLVHAGTAPRFLTIGELEVYSCSS